MNQLHGSILREDGAGCLRVENPLVVNAKDGSVLVYVPPGEFAMGEGGSAFRVELAGYWIGVYAVSNAQYMNFQEEVGSSPRSFSKDELDNPVGWVNWDEAVRYAKWAGCELASEAQWERACRGPLGLLYPWGNEWDEAKCQNSTHAGSSVVYQYPKGVSGWGTYNQSGNVSEWCADRYSGNDHAMPRKNDALGMVLVRRGGSFGCYDPRQFRAAYRDAIYKTGGSGHDYEGFRLVRQAS